jgi:hypothetical protein
MTESVPAISYSQKEREEVLAWLRHGVELARDLKGETASHRDAIWSLLVEAIDLMERVPDQERRWLTSGHRSGGWNMVGMTIAELREIEKIRILCAMKPYDGKAGYSPQRGDVDRAVGVLCWLRWLTPVRNAERLRKAALALARTGDSEIVHRLYCPTRKRNRQNVAEIKTKAIGYILSGLKTVGIVPDESLGFKEAH